MTFVVPRIAKMYTSAHVNLPKITRILIDISNFMLVNYQKLILVIFGGILILYLIVKHIRIATKIWEKIKYSLPIFGDIARKRSLIMFSGNLGFLLKHGVLISEALPITKRTLGSILYQEELDKITAKVIAGESLSKQLLRYDKKGNELEHPLFPYEISQLVEIGENTGLTHSILTKIKNNYLKAINTIVKNLSSLLEPILIVFIGALVGGLLLAIMMPFFYIGSTIQ